MESAPAFGEHARIRRVLRAARFGCRIDELHPAAFLPPYAGIRVPAFSEITADPEKLAEWIMPCNTPWSAFFFLSALFELGESRAALDWIRMAWGDHAARKYGEHLGGVDRPGQSLPLLGRRPRPFSFSRRFWASGRRGSGRR